MIEALLESYLLWIARHAERVFHSQYNITDWLKNYWWWFEASSACFSLFLTNYLPCSGSALVSTIDDYIILLIDSFHWNGCVYHFVSPCIERENRRLLDVESTYQNMRLSYLSNPAVRDGCFGSNWFWYLLHSICTYLWISFFHHRLMLALFE